MASYWLLNPPKKRKRKGRRKRNPQLALYGNPPRKKGRATMARRKKAGSSSRGRHRRRRRRNPPMIAANPKRRRRGGRRRRRNPFIGGGRKLFGMSIPPVRRILGGVAGVAATRAVPGYLSKMLPMIPQTGALGLVVKATVAIATGTLVGNFMGKQFGEDMAFGGLVAVTDDAAREFVYPAIGLSAYLEPSLQAYLQPGLSQYLSPGATLPALGEMNYDFTYGDEEDEDELSGLDVPARLDSGSRL